MGSISATPVGLLVAVMSVVAGCRKQEALSPDQSQPLYFYESRGMPRPDHEWRVEDYDQAARCLSKMATEEPLLLPRFKSDKSGKLFDHLADDRLLTTVVNSDKSSAEKFVALEPYVLALRRIGDAYFRAMESDDAYWPEFLRLFALNLQALDHLWDFHSEYFAHLDANDPEYETDLRWHSQVKSKSLQTLLSFCDILRPEVKRTRELEQFVTASINPIARMTARLDPPNQDAFRAHLEKVIQSEAHPAIRQKLEELRVKLTPAKK